MCSRALWRSGGWQCPQCGKPLGTWEGGRVVIRHHRVALRASLPLERCCERCGTWCAYAAPGSGDGET